MQSACADGRRPASGGGAPPAAPHRPTPTRRCRQSLAARRCSQQPLRLAAGAGAGDFRLVAGDGADGTRRWMLASGRMLSPTPIAPGRARPAAVGAAAQLEAASLFSSGIRTISEMGAPPPSPTDTHAPRLVAACMLAHQTGLSARRLRGVARGCTPGPSDPGPFLIITILASRISENTYNL